LNKKIAFGAVFSALCIMLLAIGSLITTLDISLAVYAGLIILVALIEYKDKTAWLMYFTVSVLSLIILPEKSSALMFALFCGFYPMMKKYFEALHYVTAWVVKISFFNTTLLIFILAAKHLFMLNIEAAEFEIVFIALANVCFVLYDIVMTRLIVFYVLKIRKRLGFKNELI